MPFEEERRNTKPSYILERSRKGTEGRLCVERSFTEVGVFLALAVQGKRSNEPILLQPRKMNCKGVWIKNTRAVSQ